jgi:hypothetical protein
MTPFTSGEAEKGHEGTHALQQSRGDSTEAAVVSHQTESAANIETGDKKQHTREEEALNGNQGETDRLNPSTRFYDKGRNTDGHFSHDADTRT